MKNFKSHAKLATKLALLFAMTVSLTPTYSIHANEGETNPTSGQTEPAPQPTVEQSNKASTRAADVVKPVIDKVEFPDNGKTFEVGETIPIYVTAHDDGSDIKEVRVVYYFDDDSGAISDYVCLTLNEETERYEGGLIVTDDYYQEGRIDDIIVTDNMGNYEHANVQDDNTRDYLYKFRVNINPKEGITYHVKSFQVVQQGQTLDIGDTLDIKIEFEEELKDLTSLELYFENSDVYDSIFVKVNSDLKTGSINIENAKPGKYVLKGISARSLNEENIYIDMTDTDSHWFNIKGDVDKEAPVITSIEMDKKGQNLKAGDTINFSVKAKDNEGLYYYAYLYLQPMADIQYDRDSVDLYYDEIEECYKGSFTIPDNMYPCEWVIDDIYLIDTSDNYADFYEFAGSSDSTQYYFNVIKDGTFTNPSYDVNVSFHALDENGVFTSIMEWEKEKVLRRTTLKEAGLKLPNEPISYKGLVFKGWVDDDGNPIDLNKQVTDETSYQDYYAIYDKVVIPVTLQYPTNDLKCEYRSDTVIVPNNLTYGELIEYLNKNTPKDMYTGDVFSTWRYDSYTLDDDVTMDTLIPTKFYGLTLQALYKNKVVLDVYEDYFGENGKLVSNLSALLVDKGVTYSDVLEQFKNDVPKSFKGLRFKSWSIFNSDLENDGYNTPVKDYSGLAKTATYENYMVRFLIDPSFNFNNRAAGSLGDLGVEYIKCIVAEPGERIKLPDFPEYKNITWTINKPEGDNLVINKHTDFYGYGEKVDQPVNPDNPDKVDPTPDTKPDVNPKPNEKPNKNLDKETVKEIVEEVKKAPAGKTVHVDMKEATVVPEEVLENIKGKDVTVNLDMGAYTWSINGKDIKSLDLKNIDLEVKMDTNLVPSKLIKELAGDQPVKTLSLTHNGDFGFKANLTLNIGKEYKGKYGNLYYYDSDGKLVFMNAGEIDADGNVAVSFSHASEYVIVVGDKAATPDNNNDKIENNDKTDNNKTDDKTPVKGDNTDTDKPSDTTTKTNTPDTGDTTNNNALIMLMMVSGAAIAFMVWNRKKHAHEVK